MAAEVVGTAFVRIRALTKQLSKEIKDGVDKGIQDAKLQEQGAQAGDDFNEGLGESLDKGIPEAIGDGFDNPENDEAAREGGERSGDSWNTAFHKKMRDSMGESVTDVFIRSRRDREADIELGGERDGEDYGDGFERGSRGRLNGVFSGLFGGVRNVFRREGGRLVDFLFDDDGGGGPRNPKNRGASIGRRFLGGLTGSLSGAAALIGSLLFNPVTLIGGLVVALGPILINSVIGIVSQLGTLVNAALGGVLAAGAGAVSGLLALGPLIAAFTVQTPLLELFKEEMSAIGEEFKVTAELVQEQVLPGVILLAETIVDALLPAIDDFAVAVGDAFGDFTEQFADLLASEEMVESITNLLNNSAEGFRGFLEAMIPFSEFVIRVLEAMSPLASVLADDMKVLFERWRDFVTDRGADGLTRTFRGFYDTFKLVMGGLADLTVALYNILRIGDSSTGQGFFERFREFAREFREFTTSESGVAEIQGIFERAQPVLSETWGLLGDIAAILFEGATSETATGGAVAGLKWIRETALPFLTDEAPGLIEGAMSAIGGFIGPVVEAIKPFAESMVAAFSPLVQEVMDYYIEKGPEFRDIFVEMLEALEEPLTKVAENLAPAFESFFDIIVEVEPAVLQAIAVGIVAIADALAYLTSIPGLSEFLGAFTAFTLIAVAVGRLAGAFAALKGALAGGAIMGAFTAIGSAIITVASGFGILIGLPAALVGAIAVAMAAIAYLIITNWDAIWDFVTTRTEELWNALEGYFEDLRGLWDSLWETMDRIGDNINQWVRDVIRWFDELGTDINGVIEDIVGWFTDLPGRLGGLVESIGGAAADIGSAIWNGITSALSGAGEFAGQLAGAALDAVRGLTEGILNGIIDAINSIIPDHVGKVEVEAFGRTVTIFPGLDLPNNPIDRVHLAMGGIFDRATPAVVGEAGKEVVIPLTRPDRALQLALQSGLFDVLARASNRPQAAPITIAPRGDDTAVDRIVEAMQRVFGDGVGGDTVQLVMPAGIGAGNAVAVAHATVRELRSDKWRRGK